MAIEFDESLNTRHISGDYGSYESARTGFFTLIVDDLTNLLKPDYSGDPAQAAKSDYLDAVKSQDSLRLNVIKAPVPHFSLGTEQYRRGNDVVKFATVPTWDNGSMVVDDIVGLDTKSILMS